MIKKILVIMNQPEPDEYNGISKVVITIQKAFRDDPKFEFEYAVNEKKGSKLPEILKNYGGKYFHLPNKKNSPIKYLIKLSEIYRNGKYDIVHVHGNSYTMGVELFLARIYGIKNRIAHCHNDNSTHKFASKFLEPLFNAGCNCRLACSDAAGKWIYKNNKFIIINNAFDYKKFAFNSETRIKYRKLLSIDNSEMAFGFVGMINTQKNIEFSLKLFKNFHDNINSNSVFIIIGDGDLRDESEKIAHAWNNHDYIRFLGQKDNPEDYMQAFDCFLLPSLWEGVGISLLEAQISGCYCFASNNVHKETKLINTTQYMQLNIEEWTKHITRLMAEPNALSIENRVTRSNEAIEKINSLYNLQSEKEKLKEIYK